MERNNAITTLEVLKANCSKHSRDYQAFEYAINSLKTDESYQIMYEGVNVYTEDEVKAMFEELQKECEKKAWRLECLSDDIEGRAVDLVDVNYLIVQKINSLKGEDQ